MDLEKIKKMRDQMLSNLKDRTPLKIIDIRGQFGLIFDRSKKRRTGSLWDYKTGKAYSIYETGKLDNPTGNWVGWDSSPELITALKDLLSDLLFHGDVIICKNCGEQIYDDSFERIKLDGSKRHPEI